ncbi:cell division protein FtsL [Paracoccus sp. 1_MG-2023]|uniref:cell division protein FtsL n=1 Tax=unclassified Paracoccus (in: a-proteobacteria) TaxID=2688777 RepID=UPI001C08B083|nr:MULTISPECIES: cell division protein FtsL [unclassified Paracoccus (in: a-proteobacteria)]MBU2957579.1 cell division protein FtsL [Paracoccus sp. C2R09]MDO6669761.1 cell division protein FtsL [Paracoccus sp. 1_MG-2023]
MRSLAYLAGVLVLMGLAFWAYRENYATQAAIGQMGQVQREIAGLREELGVLRAEWAYLNRPDRLSGLVDLNFNRLQLVPLESEQFVGPGHVDYPKPPEPAVDPEGVAQIEEQP